MSYHSKNENDNSKKLIWSTVAGTSILGVGAFLFSRYKVCNPNQYLVKTGLGIKDINVSKKAFLLPFQKYQFINMNPKSYRIDLQNMVCINL